MLVKNYRPISLLPIFRKMFERVIYNSLFNYFESNRLFTRSQSGFLPGDSCIPQLLSIIHEIQTAFDENPTADVKGVFLDLSKAFDKVWHDGIIFKLKSDFNSPSKKIICTSFNDSSSIMMKNVFYFILEALFVLKIFKFLS